MCQQLGIDYWKLTPEEFQLLMKVLAKSKHLKYSKRETQEEKKMTRLDLYGRMRILINRN